MSVAISSPVRKNRFLLFRRFYWVLLILLFVAAVGHRWVGIGIYPAPHSTDDEYDNLWSGVSQLEGGPPIGWSLLPDLPAKNKLGHYRTRATKYPIYKNYVDHPPLFQLLTGAMAKAGGVRAQTVTLEEPAGTTTLWFIKLKKLRILSLILFAISFVLAWKWLRLSIGPVAAFLALMVFSFLANFVLHHRLVVADNLIVPCALGLFLMLEKWKRNRAGTVATAVVVGSLAAAAVLSKLIALILVPGVVAWSMASFRGKKALGPIIWVTVGAMLGVLIYVGYACYLDKEAFLGTMKSHTNRFKNFYGIGFFINTQQEIHVRVFSLWIVAAWIYFFTYASRLNTVRSPFFAAGMGMAFGYVFFAPEGWHGWHMIPFFIFLAAAWGVAVRGALRNPAGMQAVVLLFLLTTETLSSEMIPAKWLTPLRYSYIGIGALLFFPWGFRWDSIRKLVIRVTVLLMFFTGLGLQIYKIRAAENFWAKEEEKRD